MYVREKRISRGDKVYSYWQLVEGERVDGKVRQRVVKHLGPLAPEWDREIVDLYARRMGLLCGALECGRVGIEKVEAREHLAEEYFVLLLCGEHREELRSGEILRSVSLLDPYR